MNTFQLLFNWQYLIISSIFELPCGHKSIVLKTHLEFWKSGLYNSISGKLLAYARIYFQNLFLKLCQSFSFFFRSVSGFSLNSNCWLAKK